MYPVINLIKSEITKGRDVVRCLSKIVPVISACGGVTSAIAPPSYTVHIIRERLIHDHTGDIIASGITKAIIVIRGGIIEI